MGRRASVFLYERFLRPIGETFQPMVHKIVENIDIVSCHLGTDSNGIHKTVGLRKRQKLGRQSFRLLQYGRVQRTSLVPLRSALCKGVDMGIDKNKTPQICNLGGAAFLWAK